MANPFVAVTDTVFPDFEPTKQVLSKVHAEFALAEATTPEAIVSIAQNADAVLVCYAKMPPQVIERLVRCKIIARTGIGYDNVDIDAATRKNIVVTNVPEYCEDEVSDHAMAMLLALIRKIPFANKNIYAGTWDTGSVKPIRRIRGRTLGLVGFGKIPKLVAKKAQAFGLQVQTFDPYIPAEATAKLDVKSVSFPELLRSSDFVSIHAPLTPETQNMFNADAFRQMKRGALLINTARGPLVDIEALVDALEQGQLAGAALDVLPLELPPSGLRLLARDNVILTPHIGFYSEESMIDLQTKAAQQVALVLSGKPPKYPVNLKELQAKK